MATTSAKRVPVGRNYPGIWRREIKRGDKLTKVYDFKHHGRWKCAYTSPRDAARARDDLRRREKLGPTLAVEPPTFEEFLATDWREDLDDRVRSGALKGSTAENYQRDVDGHLRREFGNQRIDWIDRRTVDSSRRRLNSRYSPHTVSRLITTLSGILALAAEYDLISANPCRSTGRRRSGAAATPSRAPVILTPDELRQFAAFAPTPDEERLILTAGYTGARQGELFALAWSDVQLDDDGGAFVVRERYYRGALDKPKTRLASRETNFGATAAVVLRAQAAGGRDSQAGLVFPSRGGRYWNARNFLSRVWAPTRTAAAAENAKFETLTFHHLRHFFVSHIRAQGLPAPVSKQIVGHGDDRTHDGYTHALPGFDAIIRAAHDQAFAPRKKAP
jgi:integrase